MSEAGSGRTVRRSIGGGSWFVLAICAVGAVFALGQLIQRLIEVLPDRDVPVTVPFGAMATRMPVGPGDALETVQVTEGVVHVSHLGPAVVACFVIAAVAHAAVLLVPIAGFAILSVRLLNGRFFHRGNARVLITTGLVVGIGWAVEWGFARMGDNGAFSRLSGMDFDNPGAPFDWVPIGAAFALVVLAAAFEAGAKIQRTAEGLV